MILWVHEPLRFTSDHTANVSTVTGDCVICDGEINPLDRERSELLLANVRNGSCALLDGRCITHGEPDTTQHHFHANPGAFND